MKKDGLRCVCGKIAKSGKMNYLGHKIGCWKCSCGESYLNPVETERIRLANRLKNSKFEIKVGKIRSNLIVRIPKDIGDLLGMQAGNKLTLTAKPDRIELIL
jgi:hypothetical protein